MGHLLSSADLDLARRLEAAEAGGGLAAVEGLRRARADLEAASEPIAGGRAVFAGRNSPLTRALGIGMDGAVSEAEFDRLEEFFRARQTNVVIDLCPMAHASVAHFIQTRGYRIEEFNNVMARRLASEEAFAPGSGDLYTTRASPAEARLWIDVVAQGFLECQAPPADFLDMFAGTPLVAECFLAFQEALPVAAAGMFVASGVAALFGDATLLHARGRGCQMALIYTRLEAAARAGCDLAMASVPPGSGSHRNYERAGFQLVYMRVNVGRNC
jgi:GNAT superfamily N-acetyltransferase